MNEFLCRPSLLGPAHAGWVRGRWRLTVRLSAQAVRQAGELTRSVERLKGELETANEYRSVVCRLEAKLRESERRNLDQTHAMAGLEAQQTELVAQLQVSRAETTSVGPCVDPHCTAPPACHRRAEGLAVVHSVQVGVSRSEPKCQPQAAVADPRLAMPAPSQLAAVRHHLMQSMSTARASCEAEFDQERAQLLTVAQELRQRLEESHGEVERLHSQGKVSRTAAACQATRLTATSSRARCPSADRGRWLRRSAMHACAGK